MNKISFNLNNNKYTVYIRDDADESVFAEIFKKRDYKIVEPIIREAKDVILDVGGHVGFFSIYTRSLNNRVPIIVVEPEPENLFLLHKHIEENNICGVRVFDGALAADSGRRHLQMGKDNHNHKLLSRLSGDKANTTIVNSWSLSEILKKCIIESVSLIKMDIEGGEFEVLEGLKEKEFKRVGAFIIEYHRSEGRDEKDLETILRENGFGVQIFPSKYDKKMGFIFAVNKRK